MTSGASSSQNDLETGFKLAEEEKLAFPAEDTWMITNFRRNAFAWIVRAIKSDWSPAIRDGTERFMNVCAVVYSAGYVSGKWVHRLNDRFTRFALRRD